MLRSAVCLMLTGVLLNVAHLGAAAAGSKAMNQRRRVDLVRRDISSLGAGPGSRIQVDLLDGGVLKGGIAELGEDVFTICEAASGKSTTVAYHQVRRATGSNGLKVVRIVVAVVAVIGAVFVVGALSLPKS